MTGLYVHVPFCLSKCPYCDFYSVQFSRTLAEQYSQALIRNIDHYNECYDTVYFGGGTPVLLYNQLGEIMCHLRLASNAEITVEANPCCVNSEILTKLKNAGINRLSFGIQSMNDNELKALGRRHTAEIAEKAIKQAKQTGFENISADLMLAIPQQTLDSLAYSIEKLCSFGITHVSAYLLKIEENTPFAAANLQLPDEDLTAEMYLKTVELLQKNGLQQYEISNFAQKSCQSRHNLKYWRCEDYLGLGPAAHSYYKGKRFYTERNLESFINSPLQLTCMESNSESDFEEFAMLKLRLSEGLTRQEVERFDEDFYAICRRANRLPDGYVHFDENHVNLTKNGFLVSNEIICKLLGY